MAEHGDVAEGPGWRLHCGRWQDVLADVTECDAVITDPPYGERTHAGHNAGVKSAKAHGTINRRDITYDPWDQDDIGELVSVLSGKCRGWWFVMTSHDLGISYQTAFVRSGLYAFQPVPLVKVGGRVRLTGDGPSSWTVYGMAARPRNREFASWGTLPGAYITRGAIDRLVVPGGKDIEQMRPIVRDYSRPGDLIVDPCAGGGTTLLAAVMEGRRAIGAEMDPDTFEKAVARLRRGYTPDLFAAVTDDAPAATQGDLF